MKQQELKKILTYNEKSGKFHWIKNGKIAGWREKTGYVRIKHKNKKYAAHRLAFIYVYGYLPKEIDHINHIKHDNRIENLRECNRKENTRNRSMNKNNKSGKTGVFWCNTHKVWRASIKTNNKNMSLGSFRNINNAIEARIKAEKKYGFHKNHGK